jgi:hypothetical protein
VGERPFALGQQGLREVVERSSAGFAAVAFEAWPVVVRAPGARIVTLTTGTLERTSFPSQRMDIGITGFSMEELVGMGEDWHS